MNAGGDMLLLQNFYQNAIRCGFVMEEARIVCCIDPLSYNAWS